MSNKINEYRIKFRRKLSIGEPLEIDKTYRIGIDVEVGAGSKISNQDGTHSLEFTCDVVGGELLKATGDVVILLPAKKGSHSQMLKKQIHAIGEDYDEIMGIIRGNLEEIVQDYKYNR